MHAADRKRAVERGLVPSLESRPSKVSDHLVADRMALYAVPAISVAVIHGGEIDWTAAYGHLAGDQPTKANDETLFQCCSISKMVASLTALTLVAPGKLDLLEPVNAKLRRWKLRDAAGREVGVSLRQILSHTAGVNVHGAPGYPRGAKTPSLLQILEGESPAITAPVRVTNEPGRTYRYSGGGYCVLQCLIEDVTGHPFAKVAHDQVLSKLGMKHSTYEQPLPNELWKNAASAHLTLSKTPCHEHWFVYPEQAVGGLWTTANDLAQVVIEIQRAIQGKGKVLPEELATEMLAQQSSNYNVGLGTYVTNYTNPASAFFSHTGAHLGWQAIAMGYLETGDGAVVLTNNGYTGSELYREVLLSIRDVYGWKDFNGSFGP